MGECSFVSVYSCPYYSKQSQRAKEAHSDVLWRVSETAIRYLEGILQIHRTVANWTRGMWFSMEPLPGLPRPEGKLRKQLRWLPSSPPILVSFPKRSFGIEEGGFTGIHDDVGCAALRWVPGLSQLFPHGRKAFRGKNKGRFPSWRVLQWWRQLIAVDSGIWFS